MNNGLRPISHNFSTAFGLLFFFPETLFPLIRGTEGVLEPSGFWNARRAILYCLLAGDIISVLLSSGTALGLLEQSLGSTWNARSATGTEP